MRKKFTTIGVTPEIKEEIKEVMQAHPKYYDSYDKFLKVAVIILRTYRPEIIFTVCRQAFPIVKIPADMPKKLVKKTLDKALDTEESLIEAELEG